MKKPNMPASRALMLLREGNERFIHGKSEGPNRTREQRVATAQHGQEPFAAILSCSDSRVPLSVLFDRGIGDIFSVRVAGNVCSEDLVGSIEYSMLHLGTPLIVVLGHSRCGALTSVVHGVEVDGNLIPLVRKLAPALDRVLYRHPDISEAELVEAAIRENVWMQVEILLRSSSHICRAINEGRAEVVAAVYDVEHGVVEWLGRHPEESNHVD